MIRRQYSQYLLNQDSQIQRYFRWSQKRCKILCSEGEMTPVSILLGNLLTETLHPNWDRRTQIKTCISKTRTLTRGHLSNLSRRGPTSSIKATCSEPKWCQGPQLPPICQSRDRLLQSKCLNCSKPRSTNQATATNFWQIFTMKCRSINWKCRSKPRPHLSARESTAATWFFTRQRISIHRTSSWVPALASRAITGSHSNRLEPILVILYRWNTRILITARIKDKVILNTMAGS